MSDDRDAAIRAEIALRQSLDREPLEVFCDWVDVFDDHEMLRFVFSVTRPEASDRFGNPAVPVARIAISRRKFDGLYGEALKKFGALR